MAKKKRQDAIDELTLALMYLTRFPDREGNRFDEITWKGYDFDAVNRLDEKDLIFNTKNSKGGSPKYAYMTEKGRTYARAIIENLGIEDYDVYERFAFRTINTEEAEEAAKVEAACFPPNEACTLENMKNRISKASDLFLVAIDKSTGKIAGFINGIATDEYDLRDEFFTELEHHYPNGKNIMILSVAVHPDYQKQGLARELIFNYCRREQERGRKRLILTCLPSKVKMYSKFGFRDLGESTSTWGGAKWHEMEIILNF